MPIYGANNSIYGANISVYGANILPYDPVRELPNGAKFDLRAAGIPRQGMRILHKRSIFPDEKKQAFQRPIRRRC
jgi:hypothetical protein